MTDFLPSFKPLSTFIPTALCLHSTCFLLSVKLLSNFIQTALRQHSTDLLVSTFIPTALYLPALPVPSRYFSAYDNNLQSLGPFLFTEAAGIVTANFSRNDLATVDHRAFMPVSPHVLDLSHNGLTRTHFFSLTATKEVRVQLCI